MARVNVSAVWDRSTEFLADNLGAIMPIALAWIAAPVALYTAIAPLAADGLSITAVFVHLAGIVIGLVTLWGKLQIIALAIAPDRPPAGARALATARLPVVIGLTLLMAAVVVLLMMPILVALGVSGIDISAMIKAGQAGTPAPVPEMSPALGGFIALYALALLPVLLWAAARLALLNGVALAERLGVNSFARSYSLTRGNGWALVGLLILLAVVSGVAALAAKTVFGSLLGLVLGGEGQITIASVITAIVTALVSTAFAVLASAFVGKFYLAARAHDPVPVA